jgi:outer membrane protein assembly factor BamB
MPQRWGRSALAVGFALGIGLILTPGTGRAFVMKLIPLRERLASPYIIQTRVEKIHPEKPGVVLAVDTHLKGKLPIDRFPINLKGDSDGKKYNHAAQILKRLAVKLPVILFVDQRLVGKPERNRYNVFGFTNGTWFQVIGREDKDKKVSWAFTHCEPYLRRTFAGTTNELRQIILDGLSGKKRPPEPNEKEKPGLGPEIRAEEKTRQKTDATKRHRRGWPLFAISNPQFPLGVIPTLGIGGPLAVLAMLFPGLFGGALLVLRNWASLLVVAGLNSTLLLVSLWFPGLLRDTWLATGQGLWYTMLLITLAGTLWAWRAHHWQLGAGQSALTGPTRTERVILWIASTAFLITFLLIYLLNNLSADDPSWKLLLVFTIGFWAAALYLAGHRLYYKASPASRPPMPVHVIVLWGMIFASTCLAATWPVQRASVTADLSAAKDGVARVAWQVVFPKGGFVVSPPLVDGDRVYVAAAHKQGGADTFGVAYCLNLVTGKEVWKFDNDGEMLQVFSAPTIADGRLFIGEGFHENKGCRLYCLNAATGKKIWDFPTESHTESSPCVAGDKVYIGAGDDGVYCVDVRTGKKVWQYPSENSDTIPTIFPRGANSRQSKKPLKLHVDASPLVMDGRVYAGSGVDRDGPGCEPAIFCLDAVTGKRIWLMPLLSDDLPVWGSPVGDAGKVYFGIGNGDIISDANSPTGALLCVNARTGQELWRFRIDNSVLRKPALDERSVYFGSRNGVCYCLDKKTGGLRWKQEIGSPIIASPTLFRCNHCGTNRLYVLGTQGKAHSFDPATGFRFWEMDFSSATLLPSTPCVATVHTPQGERRRIYFGAGLAHGEQAALICLEEK